MRRSVSGALSDADDEDDDEDGPPRRSLSPRRDKKMEKIRAIINEALAAHQSRPQTAEVIPAINLPDSANVLQKLEEMKEQFGQSMRLDLRGEDLRNIVEEAVEKRMPTPRPDESALVKEAQYQSRITDLEERLRRAAVSTEEEIRNRRTVKRNLQRSKDNCVFRQRKKLDFVRPTRMRQWSLKPSSNLESRTLRRDLVVLKPMLRMRSSTDGPLKIDSRRFKDSFASRRKRRQGSGKLWMRGK